MRTLLLTLATFVLAGCASAPSAPTGQRIAVDDHKHGGTRYAYRSTDSDFVGTSAKSTDVAKRPPWYRSGHP